MADGYLVTLGDGSLGTGDNIIDPLTTFTEDTVLGDGVWVWSGTYNGTTYTNTQEDGSYVLATDGNVYFVPDYGPVSTISTASVISAPNYPPPDGTVAGGAGDDIINADFDDDFEGDRVTGADNTIIGGAGNDSIEGRGGDDTILGGSGNDTIHGDSAEAGTATAQLESMNWSAQGANGTDLTDGFTQDTGTLSVNVRHTNDGNNTGFVVNTQTQYTETGEPFSTTSSAQLTGNAGPNSTVTIEFAGQTGTGQSDTASDISFRINDVDIQGWTDVVTVNAYDIDGNLVPVSLTLGGADTITGNTVTGAGDADDPDEVDGSVLVNIAGPAHRIDIIYENDNTAGQALWLTDLHFSTVPETGDDDIDGGDGDDTLFGDVGHDTLDGGADADQLFGGSGNDQILGGTGADTLTGGSGNDTLFGGDGSDAIQIGDDHDTDVIAGGEDTGDTDTDTLTFFNNTSTAGVTLTGTGFEAGTYAFDGTLGSGSFSEIEAIITTGFDDTINMAADSAGLTLNAGAGDDTITAGTGNDTIIAGPGADTVTAGAGNDTITLDSDGDPDLLVLADGAGQDIVTGFDAPTDNGDGSFTGQDMLDVSRLTDAGGQPVNTHDVTVTNDGSGNAVLSFPNGETLTLIGISPTDADDPFYLNAIGVPLPDGTVSGTAGNDLIDASYDQDPDGDFVDANDAILPGDTGNDDLIEAGDGNDTIYAGDGNDSVLAGAGTDTVFGGTGDDDIDGQGGPDTIFGGDGNDTITGSGSIMGGDGDDFIETTPGVASSVDGGAGHDTIIDMSGPGMDDTLLGGSGDDFLLASEGNDSLYGGTGNDVSEGYDGDDFFYLEDNYGTDFIGGGETDETTGDTLDATAVTSDQVMVFIGDEDGTLQGAANTGDPVTDEFAEFFEIENFFLGSGNDSIDTATHAVTVDAGTGDDTFLLGDGFGASTFDGNEGGETTGDLVDGAALTSAVTVDFSADEAGTITDGATTVTFDDIERINTGAGNDTITGSGGRDSIHAGGGADTILGGAGNDDLSGGAGNDTLNAGDGADSIYGGDGDDWISLTGSFGNDTIVGGEAGEVNDAADQLDAGTLTADVTVTFSGAETGTLTDGTSTATFSEIEAVQTGSGDDTVFGDVGHDTISTLAGDDTVFGGAGNDFILSGSGNDTILAGTGRDTIIAGDGNDQITLGEGDQAQGDDGDDTFTLTDDVVGAGNVITILGGAGNETGGDTLRLGSLGDLTDVLANAVDDGTGSYSGTFTLDDGTVLTFSEIENIICFTPGTMIATPRGARDIADLAPGDLVVTRDHGLQPIRWIQRRTVPALDRFAPVRIRPGVMTGLETDLLVSPQHRMLFQGYRAELLFGESEVLVAAKHLIDGIDVTQEIGGDVTYIHMMFDEHEIVFAQGAATESFHPGEIGLSAVEDAARDELFALFPALRSDVSGYGQTARRCLKQHEADLLRI